VALAVVQIDLWQLADLTDGTTTPSSSEDVAGVPLSADVPGLPTASPGRAPRASSRRPSLERSRAPDAAAAAAASASVVDARASDGSALGLGGECAAAFWYRYRMRRALESRTVQAKLQLRHDLYLLISDAEDKRGADGDQASRHGPWLDTLYMSLAKLQREALQELSDLSQGRTRLWGAARSPFSWHGWTSDLERMSAYALKCQSPLASELSLLGSTTFQEPRSPQARGMLAPDSSSAGPRGSAAAARACSGRSLMTDPFDALGSSLLTVSSQTPSSATESPLATRAKSMLLNGFQGSSAMDPSWDESFVGGRHGGDEDTFAFDLSLSASSRLQGSTLHAQGSALETSFDMSATRSRLRASELGGGSGRGPRTALGERTSFEFSSEALHDGVPAARLSGGPRRPRRSSASSIGMPFDLLQASAIGVESPTETETSSGMLLARLHGDCGSHPCSPTDAAATGRGASEDWPLEEDAVAEDEATEVGLSSARS